MKIYVREQRADTTALRHALLACGELAFFTYPGFEESLHHPKNAPVCNPVSKEAHQPVMVHVVKESFDVRLHDPFGAASFQRQIQRAKRVVATPVRSKSIGVVYEILFIDLL